jgi:hypothetical protein
VNGLCNIGDKKMKKYRALIFVTIILTSCGGKNDDPSVITATINEDFSDIVDPVERWSAYNITNYSLEESRTCECLPPNFFTVFIVDNKVADIEYNLSNDLYIGRSEGEIYDYTKNLAMTIDEAFLLIENSKRMAHKIQIEYDARFGYPTQIFIDRDSLIIDDENLRGFSNLRRIIN